MATEPPPAMKVFICYAREDEALRQGLEKHLQALRRQGRITVWHERNISPGAEWEHEIDTHLGEAQLILLLVSSDFIDSDYCYVFESTLVVDRLVGQGPEIEADVRWTGGSPGALGHENGDHLLPGV